MIALTTWGQGGTGRGWSHSLDPGGGRSGEATLPPHNQRAPSASRRRAPLHHRLSSVTPPWARRAARPWCAPQNNGAKGGRERSSGEDPPKRLASGRAPGRGHRRHRPSSRHRSGGGSSEALSHGKRWQAISCILGSSSACSMGCRRPTPASTRRGEKNRRVRRASSPPRHPLPHPRATQNNVRVLLRDRAGHARDAGGRAEARRESSDRRVDLQQSDHVGQSVLLEALWLQRRSVRGTGVRRSGGLRIARVRPRPHCANVLGTGRFTDTG